MKIHCCVLLFLVMVLFVCLFCFSDVFFGTFVVGEQGESMQIRVFSCGSNNLSASPQSNILFVLLVDVFFLILS